MPTIYPTRHCFDDMLEYFAERLRRDATLDVDGTVFVLVHGLVRAPAGASVDVADGAIYAHAWIEDATGDDVVVWQSGLLDDERVFYSMTRAEFVDVLQPVHATRYTARAAWRENRRHGTYGPWVLQYRARCRNA